MALIDTSEGRSEFAIVIFVDIRGFSHFSTNHDSIETAVFMKRFFQILLERYFNEANYVKPTGDGLLIIYNYSEKTLRAISEVALSSVLKLIMDYDSLFVDDEMVNFSVPEKIGVGITRGTVCCLYSGKTIIDYSGKVLNLSARLMDMARPSGIVIDGQYQMKTIPEEMQELFSEDNVYVRGIQEDTPLKIFFLKSQTVIGENLKYPIKEEPLEESKVSIKFSEFEKLSGTFSVDLEKEPKTGKPIKGEVSYPHPTLEGYSQTHKLEGVIFNKTANKLKATVDIATVIALVKSDILDPEHKITLRIEYTPKQR
jgi:hypothetical protein